MGREVTVKYFQYKLNREFLWEKYGVKEHLDQVLINLNQVYQIKHLQH